MFPRLLEDALPAALFQPTKRQESSRETAMAQEKPVTQTKVSGTGKSLAPETIAQDETGAVVAQEPSAQSVAGTGIATEERPANEAATDVSAGEKRVAMRRRNGRLMLKDEVSIRKEVSSQNQEAKSEEKSKRDKPLNQEDLQRAWIGYANDHSEHVILVQSMRSSLPVLQEDGVSFDVTLLSDGQRKEMEGVRPDIMKYLSDKLENDNLKMNIVMSKMEGPLKIKTQSELWRELVETNSDVADLVERLQLTLK